MDIYTLPLNININANITSPEIICIGGCDIIWSITYYPEFPTMCQQNRTSSSKRQNSASICYFVPFKIMRLFASRSMLIAAIKPSELPEYGNSAEALVCDTLKR
jgi:hypothetical protein